ncbi:hypothetical protein STRTUCAR8_07543 [Streptomyces turgidiscabies Car8]|uniref:Uncharacterized protein n=1 Tax=Streptomyces turgidiscabies (strain Car8) TaxID=698760 RepID=L7F832_STRT8|nr:hypothetical protein STRTUCAR8_07543 [Streptomyces turgidiscabies Car8]
MVDVSRRLSLLAFVAPHCAVPSVPGRNLLRTSHVHPPNGAPGEWCQINGEARTPALAPGPRNLYPGPRIPHRNTPGPGPLPDITAAAVPNPTGPYVRGSVLR